MATWDEIEELIHFNDHTQLKIEMDSKPDFLFQIDKQGWTLLMISANSSSDECSEILIQAGAKLNQKNKYGKTALIIAVTWREFNIAQNLLEQGADVSIRDQEGESAFGLAMNRFSGKDMGIWFNLFSPYKNRLDSKDLELYNACRLLALFT